MRFLFFDRWLGPGELDQIDCADSSERMARDHRHLRFWMAIRDKWPNLLARRPGDDFAAPMDQNAYINACKIDHGGGSDSFQCAVLPAVGAIYYENWDDTNVLWFEDGSRVRELLNIAENCGLFVLEYAE